MAAQSMAMRHNMQWQYATPMGARGLIAIGAMPKRPAASTSAPPEAYREAVGRRLRWVLEIIETGDRALTQTALARRYNISQSTLNKWLAGTRLAAPDRLADFCRDFGVSLDWIYGGQLGGGLLRELELHLVARHPELAAEASASRPRPAWVSGLAKVSAAAPAKVSPAV